MAGNSSLAKAKDARQDEFYTQLTDIENELRHYRKHFSGKTVLCNCDDPYESNFFKYFALNFNRLKLKNSLPPATQVRPSRVLRCLSSETKLRMKRVRRTKLW